MNIVFSQSNYILKRQGLSIGGKYQIFGLQDDKPLLFVEEKTKWIPPSNIIHVYADDKKTQEVLTLKDSESADFVKVIYDGESGDKIGGIAIVSDTFKEFISDAWAITDANDNIIARVGEISAGEALIRELISNELPQKLDIFVGDTLVGELRQKSKLLGYEMKIDFSMDIMHGLDHRLGLAAAIFVAYHQGQEVT
jgi:hypothetical protein